MAMANKIIPKIFLIIANPVGPRSLPNHLVAFRTKNTGIMFKINAIMMLSIAYSALSDNRVVIEPAPAIIGKAIGTIVPPMFGSFLKSSIPRTISRAKKRRIKEPAIAKEDISTPNRPKNGSPIIRNNNIMRKATRVAFPDSTFPVLTLISMIRGIDPVISITANNTINEANISTRLKCMSFRFAAKVGQV